MALPSIAAPEYNTTVPSTGQEISYRPFLVKEEKLLLLAQESGETQDQILAVAKTLAACITTPDIIVGDLATFDIEYLFLKLRAKSVGENIELSLPHSAAMEGPSGSLEGLCTHRTKVTVDIDDVDITRPIPNRKIQLTDDVGVYLKYPTFQDMAATEEVGTTEYLFDILTKCIDYVYDKEEVYNDFSLEEMSSWIDGLGQAEFLKISEFFENLPKLQKELTWTCSACDKKETLLLEGLESFFS